MFSRVFVVNTSSSIIKKTLTSRAIVTPTVFFCFCFFSSIIPCHGNAAAGTCRQYSGSRVCVLERVETSRPGKLEQNDKKNVPRLMNRGRAQARRFGDGGKMSTVKRRLILARFFSSDRIQYRPKIVLENINAHPTVKCWTE